MVSCRINYFPLGKVRLEGVNVQDPKEGAEMRGRSFLLNLTRIKRVNMRKE